MCWCIVRIVVCVWCRLTQLVEARITIFFDHVAVHSNHVATLLSLNQSAFGCPLQSSPSLPSVFLLVVELPEFNVCFSPLFSQDFTSFFSANRFDTLPVLSVRYLLRRERDRETKNHQKSHSIKSSLKQIDSNKNIMLMETFRGVNRKIHDCQL